MYAVIQTGGKQYRVRAGDVVRVERLAAQVGAEVELHTVCLVGGNGTVQIGTPSVDGALVKARVIDEGRGRKVIAFKKKRRKGYRRKVGHRQAYTALEVVEIVAPEAPVQAATIDAARADAKIVPETSGVATKPAAAAKTTTKTKAVKPATKKVAKQTSKKVARKAGKKATKKAGSKVAKKARKKVAKKAGKRTASKVAGTARGKAVKKKTSK